MTDYKTERRWADKFLDRQLRILAPLLGVPLDAIQVTDDQTDKQGVDAQINGLNVGLRVRRASAQKVYGIQPTIRTSKGKDGLSELDKIKLGRLDYMLLTYATPSASTDNDDTSLQATVLLDLEAVRRAALDGFRACQTTAIDSDRVDALAIDLTSLMASYGPCVVYRQTITTTTSTTSTTAPINPISGLQPTTTTTDTTTDLTDAHHPDLMARARRRASTPAAA